MFLFCGLMCLLLPTYDTPQKSYSRYGIISLINKHREEKGIRQVSLTGSTSYEVSTRVKQVCVEKQWSHDGFYELNLHNTGEILGRDYNNAEAMAKAWVDSYPHYKVMTNPYYEYAGVGIYGSCVVVIFS